MDCIVFEYSGRFGHFLRAEANASAPSYPVPPRTALLGLAGAVLGLPKDTPQTELAEARFAVVGRAAPTHWHTANLRKDPPAPLPMLVRRSTKGTDSNQRNTIISQEWLIKPRFRVWAALPPAYHADFASRVRDERWHFSPCMGLSEMTAYLELLAEGNAEPLPNGAHTVIGVARRGDVELDPAAACEAGLSIQAIRMPRDVSPTREFRHDAYYREINGKAIPVRTACAWRVGTDKVVWL